MQVCRLKLTDQVAGEIRPGTWGEYDLYRDTEIRGFCIIVHRTVATWSLVRKQGKKKYSVTLGRIDQMTASQARSACVCAIDNIKRGRITPIGDGRQKTPATVKELGDRWIAAGCPGRGANPKPKSVQTINQHRRILERYIYPDLARLGVKHATKEDLQKIHKRLYGTHIQANRARSTLFMMFTYAERMQWIKRGTNPARKLRFFEEKATKGIAPPEKMAA